MITSNRRKVRKVFRRYKTKKLLEEIKLQLIYNNNMMIYRKDTKNKVFNCKNCNKTLIKKLILGLKFKTLNYR